MTFFVIHFYLYPFIYPDFTHPFFHSFSFACCYNCFCGIFGTCSFNLERYNRRREDKEGREQRAFGVGISCLTLRMAFLFGGVMQTGQAPLSPWSGRMDNAAFLKSGGKKQPPTFISCKRFYEQE